VRGRKAARQAARWLLGPRLEYLLVRRRLGEKTSASVKLAMRGLQAAYGGSASRGEPLPSTWDTGFSVFSEYDEDGVILFLLAVVGCGSRRFVDLGAGDGIHASNCANLAFNLGFHGLFIDADERLVQLGRTVYQRHSDTRGYPPRFLQAFVTASTINPILREAGFEGEVDVLSIDIDGNDYWIWDAIEATSARIVIIETHDEYGLEDILAPYQENYRWREAPPGAVSGASPVAMTKLATKLGYRLVGGNRLGFNAIYVRNDLAPTTVPAIEVAELLWHDRNRRSNRGGAARAPSPLPQGHPSA
jgi:hypothetical protein